MINLISPEKKYLSVTVIKVEKSVVYKLHIWQAIEVGRLLMLVARLGFEPLLWALTEIAAPTLTNSPNSSSLSTKPHQSRPQPFRTSHCETGNRISNPDP